MTTCPSCASPDVVGFTLAPKGEPLQFTHCRNCEHRWWQAIEQRSTVALGVVLDHIAA
jgi:formate dehydrogenase maturation protein FdhE